MPDCKQSGKGGIRDEAFAEVAVLLKLLCVLGSENSINRMSDNRVHQSPRENVSGNLMTYILRDHPTRPSPVVIIQVSGIYIS